MAGAEKTSGGPVVTTAAMTIGGAPRPEVVIQRPGPGAITVNEAPAGANLRLNFASGEAKILVQDVDVVLAFPDGGRVVLPGFAFNLVSAAGGRSPSPTAPRTRRSFSPASATCV
jgi:hypothetical protein